jgi:hypothetical protein
MIDTKANEGVMLCLTGWNHSIEGRIVCVPDDITLT